MRRFDRRSETIVQVLNDIGYAKLRPRGDRTPSRLRRRQALLDAFLNLAVEYEKYCTTVHEAATLTGFLFWVLDPHSPDLDLQPTVTTGDAVHVLTYHKAKGLEWPIVVTTDFDAENRSSLWDARVLLTGAFDVKAPLANRVIRFWPRLFGERRKGIAILGRSENIREALDCDRKNALEQRRLAYVGITRARRSADRRVDRQTREGRAWLGTFAAAMSAPTGYNAAVAERCRRAERAAPPVASDGPRRAVAIRARLVRSRVTVFTGRQDRCANVESVASRACRRCSGFAER